jgi:hypothetical protein
MNAPVESEMEEAIADRRGPSDDEARIIRIA